VASLHGRWEARVVVPTGGWTVSVTDSGGTDASAISLAAAETYYHGSAGNNSNDLAAEMQSQLNASATLSGTYTVTVSTGELGTGKYTIACDESYSLTWTSTALRDVCGFTANVSSQTSATGANHAQGLWLPDCVAEPEYGLASAGKQVVDRKVTLAEDGTFYSYSGASHVRNTITHPMVTKAKTLVASETTTGASFEQFWKDAIIGQQAYFTAGSQLRYYPDTSDDTTYFTYNELTPFRPSYERVEADSIEYWSVALDVVKEYSVAAAVTGAMFDSYAVVYMSHAMTTTSLGDPDNGATRVIVNNRIEYDSVDYYGTAVDSSKVSVSTGSQQDNGLITLSGGRYLLVPQYIITINEGRMVSSWTDASGTQIVMENGRNAYAIYSQDSGGSGADNLPMYVSPVVIDASSADVSMENRWSALGGNTFYVLGKVYVFPLEAVT